MIWGFNDGGHLGFSIHIKKKDIFVKSQEPPNDDLDSVKVIWKANIVEFLD
jgi:hypothetical protein